MVFSFFKKQPQPMPKRPAAQPRPPEPVVEASPPPVIMAEPLPDLEFTATPLPRAAPKPAPVVSKPQVVQKPLPKLADEAPELDFSISQFERDFTDSSVMAINVEHDLDPAQSEVERVVLLFANRQDAAARIVLETLVRQYTGPEGRRFWMLLFDLLQVMEDRPAFEKFGLEFAEACETSPPAWREAPAERSATSTLSGVFTLQGILTVENLKSVANIAGVLAKRQPVRIDCSKLIGCDDEIAGQLALMLSQARRAGVPVAVDGVDTFLARLNERLQTGVAKNEPAWQLLLELLQRYAAQDAFEERAVDYAVTFERSPPSWEKVLPVQTKLPPQAPPLDDAHFLQGDLRDQRFNELAGILANAESAVLDFSGVSRMDFFSASQLANCLGPLKAAGREAVIRSPHHLVAELMALVGLNKVARIIVPKS